MCIKVYYLLVMIPLLTTMAITSSAAAPRKCTVKQLVGTVKVRRGESTTWSDARPKMPLKQSDAIRTFVESEVELETSEGSTIKIGENSTVELKTLQGTAADQSTAVKILNGAVLANVKKLVSTGSTFEFETPTATAAIRGTIVGLEVNKEQTRVKVYEGRVLVTPQGSKNSVELKQNQVGVVLKGGEKVAVQKFDEKSPIPLSVSGVDSASVKTGADSINASSDSSAVKESVQDTVTTVDTAGQSSAPVKAGNFTLVLTSPAEGIQVAPQSPVSVTGTVKPVTAAISVNGRVAPVSADGMFKSTFTAPAQSGSSEITVSADYNGAVKTITRKITVKSSPLTFSVSVPRDGQEISKPLISVSGSVTPGAEVTVMSMKLPVTGSGSFTGQVPIANEAGEYTLDFEADLEGTTQKISRRVVYKPEYRFIVTSPPDRQTITTTNIVIKGEVLPVNAEVSVSGRRMSVGSNGQFSGYITIPDEEGEVVLEFEIAAGGINKTELRKVTYKRPPDTYRPQLSASIAKSCWNVTVFDRTVDEEIVLWYEIDGSKESTTLQPNESTCIPLENGIHTYRTYAEDRQKNVSNTEVLSNYAYLSTTTWLIKMRKPVGSTSFDLPPASPAGEPVFYTVEFTIENLPQEDMRLIREVAVTNKTNGRRIALRTFTDNFIETDIELVRQRANQIQIDVNDINNITKSHTFRITVK
jgi:hypothetical protein